MTDRKKEEWSVWTARVEYADGTGMKDRPVIVLNDRIVLCVCLAVTSKQKNIRYGYKLKNTKCAGLIKESWVRFGYIELTPDRFRRKLGMLDEEDIVGLRGWMASYSYGSYILDRI
ncbi:MAG: type II toxin-antitoxin system PemK/MazF family toxin [Methanomassiliicoccaceae archaeon]|nr:type II toxin-antitoxin system PemK/MazF family toxin [Methanomassiliicoccaceae archaeon]